ncbi:MAG: type IV secretion system DNA-binding domain-containing protein [Candidatus Bathyarchaeia archaeon]
MKIEMLERKDLLKAKLTRIAKGDDEAALSFITTLLTSGGLVKKFSGLPLGFSDYRSLWGETKYEEVKQRLIDDGIIYESDDFIGLNLPSFQYLSDEERRQIVEEICVLLFREAFPHYEIVLRKLLSSPEGQYILNEFGKIGAGLSDENIAHISGAVGPSYFFSIVEPLRKIGLFVHLFSSKRHDYYRLFPSLISAMELDPQSLEALVFVYIAQGVNSQGVLAWDCKAPPFIIDLLYGLGFIEKNPWYKLLCLKCTQKGAEKASAYVRKLLEEAKPAIEGFLREVNPRLLQYLWTEVIGTSEWPNEGRRVSPWSEWGNVAWGISDVGIREENFFCLLNDDRIRRLRDRLLEMLVQKKLSVKVYNYVSTRGGETREQVYVIAPEAKEFIHQFLERRGLKPSGPLFPERYQILHRLYHLMSLYSSQGLCPKKTYFLMGERYGLERKQIEEAFHSLIQRGIVKEEGDYWNIVDAVAYRKSIEKLFFLPLVEYVLTEERPIITPARIPMPTPILSAEPKPSPPSIRLQLVLGRTREGDKYYWEPLSEPNPHLLIVGSSGVGKTQTAKSILYQLTGKVPAFVIDFENEYGDLVGLILKPGRDITINPLDPLEGEPRMTKFRVSGILRKIYRLGDQQEALVRQVISEAYRRVGIPENEKFVHKGTIPPFNTIKDLLEEVAGGKGPEANRARAVLNRLEPIFDLEVFAGKTQAAFTDILNKGAALFLKDLPTEETKLAVAEFFIRWLWHQILQEGEVRERLKLVIVLDEAHKLAYDKSPVADFLRQGRKFGVSVILSTQQPDDFEDKELAFQNTACHISFLCTADRHAETMARIIAKGRETDRFHSEIRRLKQFEALAASSTKDATKIKVLPYFELTGKQMVKGPIYGKEFEGI